MNDFRYIGNYYNDKDITNKLNAFIYVREAFNEAFGKIIHGISVEEICRIICQQSG
jgi:hypothetical protein